MATHPCETWSTLRRTRRMHIPQHPIPGPALRCCEWGANRQRIGSSASCQSKRSLVHRLQHTNSLSYSMALYHGCCLQTVSPVPWIQDVLKEKQTLPRSSRSSRQSIQQELIHPVIRQGAVLGESAQNAHKALAELHCLENLTNRQPSHWMEATKMLYIMLIHIRIHVLWIQMCI